MQEKINQLQQKLYDTLKKAEKNRRRVRIFRIFSYGGSLLFILGIYVLQAFVFSGGDTSFFYTLNPNPTFFEQYKLLIIIAPLFILITISSFGLSAYLKKFTAAEHATIRQIIREMFPEAKLALLPSDVSPILLRQCNFFGDVSKISAYSLGMVIFENEKQKITIRDMALNNERQKWYTHTYLGVFFLLYKSVFKGAFGGRLENITDSFRGMFANATLEKTINGSVVVLPDHLESKLDYLAKNIQALKNVNGNKLVTLEDVEFERYFVVYANDEITARYVLTPAMMMRMSELKKKYNRDIMLSFNGNQFFFAVAMPEGFLTLGKSSLTSGEALKDLYDNFVTAQEILNDLKLK